MIKTNIDQLRQDIRVMTNQTILYKALKDELTRLGYWHNRPRGNPSKGYNKSVAAQQQAAFKQQLYQTN